MTKLSICIATYNRADYIGETLESILPQLTDAVEVVILDGASTDATESIVRHYAEQCSNIKYVRLQEKGGVDKDYDLAVEHAIGAYCWLFTDDDILNPGAVHAVLEQLDNEYPLIIVNANVKSPKLDVILEAKRLALSHNIVYTQADFEEFLINTAGYMSFIGCVIIRRSIWMERERRGYYGLEFIHLGVIFQEPLQSSVLVIAEPYISIRLGNAQWSERAFEIWMFKWPAIIWGFDCISVSAKAKITPREPWRKLYRLAFLRAEGNFTLNEYRRFIKPKVNLLSRVLIALVVFSPGRVVNFLAIAYYSLRASGSELAFFALRNSRNYWLKPWRPM